MAKSILDQFGIGEMPWIMRVYVLLFLSAIALILLPGMAIFKFPDATVLEIVGIGKDALKIITGAVIGSLSMAGQKEWTKREPAPPKTTGGDAEEAQQKD